MKKEKTRNWLAVLAMALLLMFTGCASNKNVTGTDAGGMPQGSNFADDIKDITLPTELVWDRNNSMIIKTESFRGGVFLYKGRVEAMSLKDYMIASMKDNKWRLVGESASKDIMLAFNKPNKTCMMVISEGFMGRTDLKLYVAIDKTAGAQGGSFDNLSQ